MLIFKGKGEVINCNAYREIKLLEHVGKIAEKVLRKKDLRIIE